jgi:hypothetical protein
MAPAPGTPLLNCAAQTGCRTFLTDHGIPRVGVTVHVTVHKCELSKQTYKGLANSSATDEACRADKTAISIAYLHISIWHTVIANTQDCHSQQTMFTTASTCQLSSVTCHMVSHVHSSLSRLTLG